MLDLEIVPERSLGGDTWEFVLGELRFSVYILTSIIYALFLRVASYAMVFWSVIHRSLELIRYLLYSPSKHLI